MMLYFFNHNQLVTIRVINYLLKKLKYLFLMINVLDYLYINKRLKFYSLKYQYFPIYKLYYLMLPANSIQLNFFNAIKLYLENLLVPIHLYYVVSLNHKACSILGLNLPSILSFLIDQRGFVHLWLVPNQVGFGAVGLLGVQSMTPQLSLLFGRRSKRGF